MRTSKLGIFVILALFGIVQLLPAVTMAQSEDNQLLDAANEEQYSLEDLQNDLKFKEFDSCQEMDTILKAFLKKFDNWDMPHYRGGPMLDFAMDEEMVETKALSAPAPMEDVGGWVANKSIASSNTDYSTTNLQKKNVDEADIIKTNGDYYFYFNQQEHKIYVLRSPLDIDAATITLADAKVETIINLPKQFNNPELYVSEDRLVILASRYVDFKHQRGLDRGSRTSVAIYDISDVSALKLLKFTDLDGWKVNSRMIDDKLYVLSQINVNRWYRRDHPILLTEGKAMPKAIDVNVADSNLDVVTPGCDEISYILPSDETIEQANLHPVFTVISVIDIDDTDENTEMNVILANAWEIHMSEDSLYIVQGIWFPQTRHCPLWAKCLVPEFDESQHTIIHKFDIDSMNIDYETSNIVPGYPINQYSMDEDNDGNFRIFTTKGWNEWTNFFTLDEDLELEGKITGIAEWEQLKASRYIWDKAYLITFERTDPLFVIDIADPSDPKMIGELMIPGFSTYLHPLGVLEDNVQYLIGLGYTANERGRQEGLQVSLYKVDYDESETVESKCSWLEGSDFEEDYDNCVDSVDENNIRISMLDSRLFGWRWSSSEAMENPRLFNINSHNVVTLPMLLNEEVDGGQNCNTFTDENGAVIEENCWPIKTNKTTFAGLKSLRFDKDAGEIVDAYSVNYIDLFKKLYESNSDYREIDSRRIRNTHMRVGYAGDTLYMINNDFAHFVVPKTNDGKYVYFDEELTD